MIVDVVEAVYRLRDQTAPGKRQILKHMDQLRSSMALAGAAASAFGLAAGAAADAARKTIVEGTGATGAALDSLTRTFEGLVGIAGVSMADTATAVADLNTHLGLAGADLETVARAALRAGADTNVFGAVARKMGLDVAGATTLLDQLTAVSQSSGVGVDEMLRSVQRVGPRFASAGVSTEDLVAMVAQLAQEAGPGGARSALSELASEVEQGNVPAFASLTEQVGLATGAVAETHAAGVTFVEQLGALKDRTMAWIGEQGNLIGSLGSVGTALIGIGPMLPALGTGFRLLWTAITGPVGLVTAAILGVGSALFLFRGQIGNVLSAVIRFVGSWVSEFVGLWESAFAWIPGIRSKLSGVAASVRGMVDDTTAGVSEWVDSWGDAAEATDDAAAAFRVADEDAATLIPQLAGVAGAADDMGAAAGGAAAEVKSFIEQLRSFEDLTNSRAQLDILGNAIVRVNSSAATASADEFWAAYNGGFISAAEDSISTTIPRIVGGIGEIPEWERAGADGADSVSGGFRAVWSPDNVANLFRDAFTGGGGVAGAVAGIGADLGRQLADSLGGALEERAAGLTRGISGSFGPLGGLLSGALTGGISTAISFGLQAIGKLGGWIKGMFGPSDAEMAARDSFSATRRAFVAEIGQIPQYQEYVTSLLSQGWDRNLAEVKAGFDLFGRQAGVTWAEIGDIYGSYQDAVKEGDEAEMARIMAIVEGWRERGGAIETGAETVVEANDSIARSGAEAGGAVVHSAEEIGRQFRGLTADEAAKLGDALINLGSKGNRAFTDIHDSSKAAANAVAALVRKLKAVMETDWRGTVRMTAVAGGERLAAAGGGVFRGPLSGYPVTLHGTETVVPGAHPGLVARPPAATPAPAAAAPRAPVQIVIHTDGTHSGRAVARAVARHLPAELRRAGVTI